jgi:hypothetical protein
MEQLIQRQDLVEADLTCLMCGRLIGQLAGLVWRDSRAQRTVRSRVSLTAFRPAAPGTPTVPLTGQERFKCPDCGGAAVMEEISVSVVRDAQPIGWACPIHGEPVQGRGRRPRGCACGDLRAAA